MPEPWKTQRLRRCQLQENTLFISSRTRNRNSPHVNGLDYDTFTQASTAQPRARSGPANTRRSDEAGHGCRPATRSHPTERTPESEPHQPTSQALRPMTSREGTVPGRGRHAGPADKPPPPLCEAAANAHFRPGAADSGLATCPDVALWRETGPPGPGVERPMGKGGG